MSGDGHVRFCETLGVRVPGATHLVAMSCTESGAREALRRIGLGMNRLSRTRHPTKRQRKNWRRGKEGFVCLGCTIDKRRSILRLPGKHFQQRWPSPKAARKIRGRVGEFTHARQSGRRGEPGHRGAESRAARLAKLLANGKCRSGAPPAGSLGCPARTASGARRAEGDTAEALAPRSALWNGPASSARHGVLSEASHTGKISVKLCAGKPLAQLERGLQGNGPVRSSGTAP
jgi:hypothetical protein